MKKQNRRFLTVAVLAVALVVSIAGDAAAICAPGRFVNPVTDVCWSCIFPIKIGGIVVAPGLPDSPDAASVPVCICPVPPPIFFRIGIPVSFWEPARAIETVKDPYCFPMIGMGFSNPSGGFLGGQTNTNNKKSFSQGHYFIFPVWGLMEMFLDSVCMESSGFDVAFITEIDPMWNDSILTTMIEPEAILWSNPVAIMACAVDSVAANLGYPLDVMFGCMGSWGMTYMTTGENQDGDYTQANAGTAARLLFKMNRLLMVCDTNSPITICTCTPTPIWIKHNYRFQISMPVPDWTCHPIGRSALLWGTGKNPPFMGMGTSADNFMWILFRKHSCCMW